MNPKTNLLLVGSSHFSVHRNFKHQFEHMYQGPEVGDVTVAAYPGKSLNLHFIGSIMDHIHKLKYQGRPLLIAIMFACNGVRANPDRNNMIPLHDHLVERLKEERQVKLILCGLIPSKDISLQKKFTNVNKALYKLSTDNPEMALFFDTASLFCGVEGYRHCPLANDGVHLAPTGAAILVAALHFFIHNVALPKWRESFFSEPLSFKRAETLDRTRIDEPWYEQGPRFRFGVIPQRGYNRQMPQSQQPGPYRPTPRHYNPYCDY